MVKKLSVLSFLVSACIWAYVMFQEVFHSLFTGGNLGPNMVNELRQHPLILIISLMFFAVGLVLLMIDPEKDGFYYAAIFLAACTLTITLLPLTHIINKKLDEQRHLQDIKAFEALTPGTVSSLLRYSSLKDFRYSLDMETSTVHVYLLLDDEKLVQLYRDQKKAEAGDEIVKQALVYGDLQAVDNLISKLLKTKKWVNYYVFLKERLVYLGSSTESGIIAEEHPFDRLELYDEHGKVYLRYKLKDIWESVEIQ